MDQWDLTASDLVFCHVSLLELHASSTRLAPITSPFILADEIHKVLKIISPSTTWSQTKLPSKLRHSLRNYDVEQMNDFGLEWLSDCNFKSGLVVVSGPRKPTTMARRDKVPSIKCTANHVLPLKCSMLFFLPHFIDNKKIIRLRTERAIPGSFHCEIGTAVRRRRKMQKLHFLTLFCTQATRTVMDSNKSTALFEIPRLSAEHGGSWECRVSTNGGLDSRKFNLTIKGLGWTFCFVFLWENMENILSDGQDLFVIIISNILPEPPVPTTAPKLLEKRSKQLLVKPVDSHRGDGPITSTKVLYMPAQNANSWSSIIGKQTEMLSRQMSQKAKNTNLKYN